MSEVSRRDFLAAGPAGTAEAPNVEAFIGGLRSARVFDLGFVWDLFGLVVPSLRIRGASGSPPRMLALTPRTT